QRVGLLLSILLIQLSSAFECGSFSNGNGVCYEISTVANGYDDAQAACKALGGEIASIHDDEENAFIQRLAVSNGARSSLLLGASTHGGSMLFGWEDGSDWDYANFQSGYPIKNGGNCLYMDTSSSKGLWLNIDCATKMPVVCARSPKTPEDPQPITKNDPRYPAYKDVADLLTSWMNTSVDPCDDFYAFTCGSGKPSQPMSFSLSDEAISETMLTQLRKPASAFDASPLPVRQWKWFYDSCIAGTTLSAIYARSVRIFNDLHNNNKGVGFPALYPAETSKANAEQLSSFLGYSVSTSGVTTLVDVGVDTNWEDPHNEKGGYALLVDQPATMFIPSFYVDLYDDYKDDIIDGIVDTINSGANALGIKNVDQTQARKDAVDVAQFDYDLATKYSTDETTRRQYERSYNPKTITDLQALAPFLNWNTFLSKALSPIGNVVDASFVSIVMEVDKLALLNADITSGAIQSRTINNYLYITALNGLTLPSASTKSAHLKQFLREKRPINRKIRRDPKRRDPVKAMLEMITTPKESICQALVNGLVMWADTRVFVDATYPTADAKKAVRDQAGAMINAILAGFRSQVDQLDWMDATSKQGAYQKIENIVVNIAYPDWVLDDAQLTAYYTKLKTTQGDDFLAQVDKLLAFTLYDAFSPLISGAPADRTDFGGPAAITNAWYQPEANSITFPGGILHAPFYDANYPSALNFGGLGVIGGHELTHGFDDEGMQWEGTGILHNWMSDSSTKGFNDMAQCVVDEYSSFCPLGDGYPCVNGEQTQGENIADNGGIGAAYNAFKKYQAANGNDPLLPGTLSAFNADQLFFLGFAQVWCQYPPSASSLLQQILSDPHSPSLYRVLGTLQNDPSFAKAFNCPTGSTYAPAKHCDVWSPPAN
ncbi:hypothetical protein PMAYCL1PPCAC_22351, partial [Pristionchus mayeri]